MDAWELSKENIQPLINGRQMTSLQAALIPKLDVISQKQNEYENQLRQYEGDDEMEIWHEYISWAEQNFYQGGKLGNLDKLIIQCVKRFINEKKYYNDDRFITVLLKYITQNGSKIEMFDKMESLGIGFESAKFYQEWAWQLDQIGNTKKAFQIIEQAINQGSKPVELLKSLRNNIVYKLSGKVNSNNSLATNFFSDEVEDRQVLSGLKPVGYKHRAPANRISNKIDLPQTVFQQQSQKTTNNIKSSKIQIYTDDGSSSTGKLTTSNLHVQSLDELYKENEQKAGKWRSVKLSQREQKVPVVPVGKTMSKHPDFSVHADGNQDKSESVPKKLPETSLVLGPKKQNNATLDVPNTNTKPMYNFAKVYGGAKEMSFEEIRAASWLANRRKIQEAIDEAAREKELKYKQEIEQLKQQLQYASSGSWSPSSKGTPDSQLSTSSAQYKLKKEDNYISNQSSLCSDSCSPSAQTGLKKSNPNQSVTREVFNLWNATLVGQGSKNSTIDDSPKNTQISEVQPQKHAQFQIFEDVTSAEIKVYQDLNTDYQNYDEKKNLPFKIYEDKKKPPFQVFEDEKNTQVSKNNRNPGFLIYQDEIKDPPQIYSERKISHYQMHNKYNQASENFEEDYLKENIPPVNDENALPLKQRELAGILVSSKNIPFKEANSEDSDSSADFDENDTDQPVEPSKTVYFPECSENETKLKMSSTPFPSMQPYHPTPAFPIDGFTIALDHHKIMTEPVEEPQFAQPQSKINKKISNEQKTNRMSLGVALSPIMERSREISKSSSSSSGYTTSHTTRNSSVFAPKSVPKNYTSIEEGKAEGRNSANPEPDYEIFQSETDNKEDFQPKIIEEDIFSTAVYKKCLLLGNSVENMPGYFSIDEPLPNVTTGSTMRFGEDDYKVITLLGKGGFGSVYKVKNKNNQIVAVKINQKPNDWEFFITNELRRRLSELPQLPVDVRDSVLHYNKGYFYTNGSALVTEFSHFGSLLDIINISKLNREKLLVEPIVMYFAWELMQILHYMHRCKIIHVDIKPDNILLMNIPSPSYLTFKKVSCLRLIDFGMAIDMTMYKEGRTFNQSVKTDGFQCPEMIEQRPWTYQQDLFGLLACIHIMLFSEYMEISKNKQNIWETKNKIKRYWKQKFWNGLFTTFLNVPSCDKIPSLEPFIKELEQFLSDSANSSQIKSNQFKWTTSLSKK